MLSIKGKKIRKVFLLRPEVESQKGICKKSSSYSWCHPDSSAFQFLITFCPCVSVDEATEQRVLYVYQKCSGMWEVIGNPVGYTV